MGILPVLVLLGPDQMPAPQKILGYFFIWKSLRDFQEINYPNKRTTEAQRTQRENFCVSFGIFFHLEVSKKDHPILWDGHLVRS
jgi:hypothetical protein